MDQQQGISLDISKAQPQDLMKAITLLAVEASARELGFDPEKLLPEQMQQVHVTALHKASVAIQSSILGRMTAAAPTPAETV